MGQFRDLTGQTFGRLKVLKRSEKPRAGRVAFECLCSCGKKLSIVANSLARGLTVSCGCRGREGLKAGQLAMRHGHARGAKSGTYLSWRAMWERCTVPSTRSYERYGGRGIAVCPRWASFEEFLADMGERPPGKTIDRRNSDANYDPANCRWATPKEQAANRRLRRRSSTKIAHSSPLAAGQQEGPGPAGETPAVQAETGAHDGLPSPAGDPRTR